MNKLSDLLFSINPFQKKIRLLIQGIIFHFNFLTFSRPFVAKNRIAREALSEAGPGENVLWRESHGWGQFTGKRLLSVLEIVLNVTPWETLFVRGSGTAGTIFRRANSKSLQLGRHH